MRVIIFDFWSDGNLGDAIMQKEILRQTRMVTEHITVVSCFGNNQFQLDAFHESKTYREVKWIPAFFKTYIRIDDYSNNKYSNRIVRLLRTFLSLVSADIKLYILNKSGINLFNKHLTGRVVNSEAVVFNGRNYRDFGSWLKNYINNRPIEFHQDLVRSLKMDVPILNAGLSIWSYPEKRLKRLRTIWGGHTIHSRESISASLLNQCRINNVQKKDLSFSHLNALSITPGNKNIPKILGLSLTRVVDMDNYLKVINETIITWLKLNPDSEVVIIEQIYLPHESTADLYDSLDFPFTVKKSKSIEEILRIYQLCSVVISTRMHGSIFSLSQGVATCSIAYDAGAKWRIIQDELPDYPLFSPNLMNAESINEYLYSSRAIEHATQFSKRIKQTTEKYVKEFLSNTNT